MKPEAEKRREKARKLRYKKALVRDLNYETITESLYEMQEECSEAAYWEQVDDDELIDALDGDEDEARAFRMEFDDLSADIERLNEDLNDWLLGDKIQTYFDQIFVACGASADNGGLMGWDDYECEYSGLNSWESEAAVKEAEKKLMALTKKDLIETTQSCVQIAFAYIGIARRYENLKAALDILKAKNAGLMQGMKRMEALYKEMAETENYEYGKAVDEFNSLLSMLPQECFLH